MAGEGLVLHLGVDGVGAKQQVGKLVKEIQTELGKLKLDFSGKMVGGGGGGASKGVRASVRNAAKEAASEIKVQQRILTQVIESGVRESQATMKRLQDRQRVESARANRAGSFDPMAPFMNPQLSGRGLSGRTRQHLQQYKDAMRAEQRERDQIMRQQIADQQRSQREHQRAQQQMARQEEREQKRYMSSSGGLARQRAKEEEREQKRKSREEYVMQRQEFASRNRNILSGSGLAKQRAREEESQRRSEENERKRYISSQSSLARQRAREDEQTAKRVESTNRQLNSMIRNPDAANYTTEGIKQRAQFVKDNIQGPRFARQQAAQRSQELAFKKRGAPDKKGIAEMFGKAGVYRADDMRRQNQRGHRGNMMGMGFYQAQQMFEDYQYAGIRGMGNNLAFMGASVGGNAGMGIIGAALALQIGELTYKMLGYADAEEKATKKAEQLAKSQLALIEIGHDVAVSFAAGEAASRERYKDLTENPEKKNAREKHVLALQQLDQLDKADPASVIQADVLKNPEKYLKYSTGRSGSVEGSMKDVEESGKEKGRADKAIELLNRAQSLEDEFSAVQHNYNEGHVTEEQYNAFIALRNKARSDYGSHVSSNYPDLSGNLPKAGEKISAFMGGDSTKTGIIRSSLLKIQSTAAENLRDKKKENEDNKARMKSPEGSRHIAESALSQMYEGDRATQEILQPLLETDVKLNNLVSERVKSNEELAKSEERIADKKHVLAEQAERIRDAEQDTDRIMKSQLSTAEDMVDSYKRKVATFKDASISSSDSFGGRMFGINRQRTAGFLEQAGASPAYIQQRDDMIVQSRLQFLRGSATSAGKAGDTDRQIEMLKELQDLQMDMAGSDSRFGVANGFFNAASGTQKEIEAAYQTQVNAATAQQQAWQGVVNSLKDAEKIKIDPMSPDAFPKLQQYLAMLQAAQATMGGLNPGMAAGTAPMFDAAQNSMLQANPDFQQANYDLFGTPHARGGLIGGMGRNDTVNARLMPHEYVIRADVVKRLGAATFEGINRTGKLPRMAGGGMFSPNMITPQMRMEKLVEKQLEKERKAIEEKKKSSKGFPRLVSDRKDPFILEIERRTRLTEESMKRPPAVQSTQQSDLVGPTFPSAPSVVATPSTPTVPLKGNEPWRLQAQQEREASKRRAAEQKQWVQKEIQARRSQRLAEQAAGLMGASETQGAADPRVAAERAAVKQMQADRATRREQLAQARWELGGVPVGASKSLSTSSSASELAQAKYDLFGNNYSVRRQKRNRGGSGGGYGGYGSSGFGGSGGGWFGGSGGPNDVYGEVLSAIAPGFSGGIGNIGGFSNRLLGGNYSGGNFSNSWWGSLASERFGRTGPNFGIRGASGGVREESQKWRGGRHRGSFHAFASGGMVQPFASSSYQPAIQAIVQGLTGGGSGSSRSGSSTVNNNRSNIGAININVTGSGTAGLAIDQARRSQHAARLRKG